MYLSDPIDLFSFTIWVIWYKIFLLIKIHSSTFIFTLIISYVYSNFTNSNVAIESMIILLLGC